MSEKKEAQQKEAPQLEIPSVELLEGELKRTKYNALYHRTLRTTTFTLVLVAAAAVIIAVLLLPILQISGGSMENTLLEGDMVISLNNGKYETGDIIGFYYNNVVLIKRVIATSGDWVDIDPEGTVTVNGVVLNEPYVAEKALGDCNIKLPYQVPQGKCFVLGDNRAESIDSRNTAVGCISNDVVLGRLLARVWPLKSFRILK